MTKTDRSQTISEYRAKMKYILAAAGSDVPAMMPAYRNLAQHFESHAAFELSETDYVAMRLVDELDRRMDLWREFVGDRGALYETCEISNFDVVAPEAQRKAVDRLTAYAKAMTASGPNLILYGGMGTGKDHLLVAISRIAFLVYGLSVRWTTGPSMCYEFREPIQIKSVTDFEVISRFASPSILYISDIVIPGGVFTLHQSELLYEIIDRRRRDERPTWLSTNVDGRQHLSKSIGAPHVDRLIDGATIIKCDWPSYRKPGRNPREC